MLRMTAIKCQQKQKASPSHSQIIEKRLSSIQEEGISKFCLLLASHLSHLLPGRQLQSDAALQDRFPLLTRLRLLDRQSCYNSTYPAVDAHIQWRLLCSALLARRGPVIANGSCQANNVAPFLAGSPTCPAVSVLHCPSVSKTQTSGSSHAVLGCKAALSSAVMLFTALQDSKADHFFVQLKSSHVLHLLNDCPSKPSPRWMRL